jgi:uridine kinase
MGSPAGQAAVDRVVRLAFECRSPAGMARTVVAIDGLGGAGKSTLAIRASRLLADAPIVHTDDFASWEITLEWWPRMIEQLLGPLSRGRPGRYQRYDWDDRSLAEWHEIEPGGVLILEGVGSSRREFRPHLAGSVWVKASRQERLRRGLERDGQDAGDLWHQWQAEEDQYLARDQPDEATDIIVDGEGGEPWPGRRGCLGHEVMQSWPDHQYEKAKPLTTAITISLLPPDTRTARGPALGRDLSIG